jgi:cytochrome c-type biogenesis protein CcmE
MTTGRKLAIAGLAVAAVTAYMAYLGAADSWQYYVTVDECLAAPGRFGGDRLRISGKVAADSLEIAADRRHARFALQGTDGRLTVDYAGPMPDKLAEKMDVVVEGRMESSGTLRCEKLLTRCASKYKSQAMADGQTAAAPEGQP